MIHLLGPLSHLGNEAKSTLMRVLLICVTPMSQREATGIEVPCTVVRVFREWLVFGGSSRDYLPTL